MQETMQLQSSKSVKEIVLLLLVALCLFANTVYSQSAFSTHYLKIRINSKGYITSFRNITIKSGNEFSPSDKPSPLLSLYSSNKKKYFEPTKAVYTKATKTFNLYYANGSVANVKFEPRAKYFKL